MLTYTAVTQSIMCVPDIITMAFTASDIRNVKSFEPSRVDGEEGAKQINFFTGLSTGVQGFKGLKETYG